MLYSPKRMLAADVGQRMLATDVMAMKREEIPHEDITYRIIGAAMRVHNRMGPGLKERHYQTALTAEMLKDGLTVSEEHYIEVYDGETWLGRLYLDHWVNECVVVEDKAVAHPTGDDELAQVIAYLAAMNAPVGLLLNFGLERLEYHRILPPKSVQNWQQRVSKYLWRPSSSAPSAAHSPSAHPLPPSVANIRDPLPPSVADLTAEMHRFVTAKGWYAADSPRPQTPRNLAASLAIETAEVLELYQWRETAEPHELAGELADVALYLLQLASVTGVDLERAILEKLQHNYQREWKESEQ